MIRLTKSVNKENYPSDWSREMSARLLELERKIFLEGYQKVFLLNHNCCCLCNDCSGDRINCKDKKKSRPSPEAFAVDVYETVRSVGMEIYVLSGNSSEMNRIAIFLIE
ncbi:MAG: hypothetical protein JXR90_11710 [Spirochaetes bacterium]|nr:hypothetical protein [Spirochaetota bacterium]